MTSGFFVPLNDAAAQDPAAAVVCSTFSCSELQPLLEMSGAFASRNATLYVFPESSLLRSTVKKFVFAVEPQRPFQSTVRAEPGVTASLSVSACAAGSDGATNVDATSLPVAPPMEAKPVAQTAPQARPAAPKASQAARRRRDLAGEGVVGIVWASLSGRIRPARLAVFFGYRQIAGFLEVRFRRR